MHFRRGQQPPIAFSSGESGPLGSFDYSSQTACWSGQPFFCSLSESLAVLCNGAGHAPPPPPNESFSCWGHWLVHAFYSVCSVYSLECFTLCLCRPPSCMFVSLYISICCFVANNGCCCATCGPRKFRSDCNEVERSCYDLHTFTAARCNIRTLQRPASVAGWTMSVVVLDTLSSAWCVQ